jgi:uncharacterized RDD family membrane protein YckC
MNLVKSRMSPPPPPPKPAFIIRGDDGSDYGPVELDELRDWVRENRAGLGTTVRLDEPGALWQPWQYYPELVALLAEVRGTGSGLSAGYSGLVLAPLGRRAAAFLIDLILIYIPVFIISLVTLIIGLPDVFIKWVVSASLGQYVALQVPPAYEAFFDFILFGSIALYTAGFLWAHGKTPGKAILRLRVVDQNGEKPSAARALLRGLVLSFSVCLYFFPLLYVFLNPQRRALHDFVAGTCVVEA